MANRDDVLFRHFVDRRSDHSFRAATEILLSLGESQLCSGVISELNGKARGTRRREIDARSYSCPDSFRRDYLAVNLMRKFPFGGITAKEREEAALTKFLESEDECRRTALRFKHLSLSSVTENHTGASYLHTMREKIGKMLPDFNWDHAARYFGHGPGATARLKKFEGDPLYKFSGTPEATYNCALLASCCIAQSPIWSECVREGESYPLPMPCVKVVEADRIVTVPKDADIDRVICKQPDMNIFVQKGVGGLLRRYLRYRAKVNLNDQTLNQRLAREGSISGELATIDLRSASDCISLELCRLVLPPDWYSAIELCRTQFGILPSGKKIFYQKVSSMGNGFTFELESLIFWAAIKAVRELNNIDERLPDSVYGDDLIVPSAAYEPLVALLGFIGLKVNETKSFHEGPFRESCGKHYFLGQDVSPFYFRKRVNTVERLYWCHNQYVLWLNRTSRQPILIGPEQKCVAELLGMVPERFQRFRIPYGTPEEGTYLGSIGLIACQPSERHRATGWFRVSGIKTATKTDSRSSLQYLARQLYHLERDRADCRCDKEDVGKKGITLPSHRIQIVKIFLQQWEDPYYVT